MESTKSVTDDEQIVGLELAGECYGMEIGRVQEIIRMQTITPVPNGPACVEGLTNLRGRVIPVVDLRKRFGLSSGGLHHRSRIVVAELGEHTVGLIVDGVSEVLRVRNDQVEPPSVLITSEGSAYLRGVAKLEDRLVLLLDPSLILGAAEREAVAA